MTKIEFYFDPGCPWCWNASRWIKEVQKQQEINVEWKSFSLLIKNGDGMNKDYLEKFTITRQMLRIIEAVKKKYGDKLTDSLYTEFGIKVHHEKDFSVSAMENVVKKVCSLDFDEIIKSKDDASLDDDIRKSMDSAFEVVGNDVGVPIIVFENRNKKIGYFGPVLSEAPTGSEALKVWQGIKSLAEYDHFFELKRTRNEDAGLPKNTGEVNPNNVCI